jgi:hypothetical protein
LKGPRGEKSVTSHQVIDLSAELGPCTYCFADARTEVVMVDETPVEFVCGSDDGLILKLNGATVISNDVSRGFKSGSDRALATLRPGTNTIACRITQGGGDWKFQVEVWDVSVTPARLLQP